MSRPSYTPSIPLSGIPSGVRAPKPQEPNCPPLQLLNEVPLGHDAGGGLTVPVKVNGQDMEFSLSSTSQPTMISQAAADQAKIPTVTRPAGEYVVNSGGGSNAKGAKVSSFELGRLRAGATTLVVEPRLTMAGILGLDFLSSYDLDLDFGADRMRLFSPNHCEGKVMYWQAPVLGRVPLVPSDVIYVRVDLDGHSILAAINTGESRSAISREVAEKLFRFTPGEADTVEMDEALPGEKLYRHVFGKLSFGDIQVQNPHIVIIPLKKAFGGTEFPDLFIGTDILRKLHLYFAFQERMMYVSPASAPETSAAAGSSQAPPAPAAPQ